MRMQKGARLEALRRELGELRRHLESGELPKALSDSLHRIIDVSMGLTDEGCVRRNIDTVRRSIGERNPFVGAKPEPERLTLAEVLADFPERTAPDNRMPPKRREEVVRDTREWKGGTLKTDEGSVVFLFTEERGFLEIEVVGWLVDTFTATQMEEMMITKESDPRYRIVMVDLAEENKYPDPITGKPVSTEIQIVNPVEGPKKGMLERTLRTQFER